MLGKRLARHGLAVSGGVLAAALCQNAASACVPGPLVVSTVQAATLMAAGKALATGAISAKVVALTEGVLKAMLMTKIKVAIAVVMALNLIGAGVGLVYCQTAGSGQPGPARSLAAADQPPEVARPPLPKPPALPEQDGIVKDYLAHLDTFLFYITLHPQRVEGKYRANYELDPVTLHVGTPDFDLIVTRNGKHINPHARITKEQAAKIVSVLARDNFFHVSGADAKRLNATGSYVTIGARYYEPDNDPRQRVVERWRPLEWNLHMVQQLEAIRACVDGEAAELLDQILKSLEDERKEWLKKEAKDDEKKESGPDPKAAAGAPPANTDAPKPLPEDIVKAWKEAGAEVGWLRVDPDSLQVVGGENGWLKVYQGVPVPFVQFVPEKQGKPGDLPAFHFAYWPKGGLAKLPAPASAFGLSLFGTRRDLPARTDAEQLENSRASSLYTEADGRGAEGFGRAEELASAVPWLHRCDGRGAKGTGWAEELTIVGPLLHRGDGRGAEGASWAEELATAGSSRHPRDGRGVEGAGRPEAENTGPSFRPFSTARTTNPHRPRSEELPGGY